MSRGQRLGLIALAIAVVAVAFVLAKPDDEKDGPAKPAAEGTTRAPGKEPTATTDTRPEERIRLRDHKASGGVRRIEVAKGDFVRVVVESDTADEIHLHGYDIERKVRPSEAARFSFRADNEGVFEIESHEAEHDGADPVIARLVVGP